MLPHLIVVVLVVAGVVWGSRFFAGVSPTARKRLGRQVGGLATLAAALFVLLRGQWEAALALGGIGAWLLGFSGTPHWSGVLRGGAAPSDLRSAMIELDADGRSGLVLAGAFEGRKLAEMTRSQCEALYSEAQRVDPDGARLLEIHLDRRFPGWRDTGQGDGDPRGRARQTAKMSENEAYEILGLAKGATADEVSRAHRSLMKRLHPDHGGSTGLAARINEARDILTRRHT